MAKSLFSKLTPRCCAYCAYGRPASVSDKILCRNKGIVPPSFECRKFRYDPLKRIPRRPPVLPSFTKDDFKL